MTLNLTPKRRQLLDLLRTGPQCIAGLAEKIAPRGYIGEHRVTWTNQGAARWGGGYVKPLEDAGLVTVDRYVDSGVGMVHLTNAGRIALGLQPK